MLALVWVAHPSISIGSPVATSAKSSPPATAQVRTPSEWHRQRRKAILEAHPEVSALIGQEATTLPLLAAVNLAQLSACVAAAHLPTYELAPAAVLIGGTLSLWQFALLHDVKHGTAALPSGVSRDRVVFWGALPSLFGYFLYLRYGHLSHHRAFGERGISELFDSEQSTFEDGDVMFVAHRQLLPGDVAEERPGFVGTRAVGGLGVSISRTVYAWLWSAREGWEAYNAAVFGAAMLFERAALVVGGGWAVALAGRNAFFPRKPASFHATAAGHARASLAIQLVLLVGCGPGALLWLYLAEVGWQLPLHPASAMFVSNHPSLAAKGGLPAKGGVGGCQPTASIYWGGQAYDWLCCFSNYHTEHHDFPDVPAFRLRALRDAAPEFYAGEALVGARDGWLATMRRTFAARQFYACSAPEIDRQIALQVDPHDEPGFGATL